MSMPDDTPPAVTAAAAASAAAAPQPLARYAVAAEADVRRRNQLDGTNLRVCGVDLQAAQRVEQWENICMGRERDDVVPDADRIAFLRARLQETQKHAAEARSRHAGELDNQRVWCCVGYALVALLLVMCAQSDFQAIRDRSFAVEEALRASLATCRAERGRAMLALAILSILTTLAVGVLALWSDGLSSWFATLLPRCEAMVSRARDVLLRRV